MQLKYNYLFNFAVSYMGGGIKRLHEYAKWFNENGGACFIVHPRCANLINEFPNNRFFVVTQPRYQRVFNDCGYLGDIVGAIGKPDLYYSYGIPIYGSLGKINWFHLSNVLPLYSRDIPVSLFDRLIKNTFLGWKIKKNFKNADVISAESNYSLSLIEIQETQKLFLSVNGSDDELRYLQDRCEQQKENIATVLGTQKYKSLIDSYYVFEMLRQGNDQLKLVIIGDDKAIPDELRNNKNITIKGAIKRNEVIECLRRTRYYISTTLIENSYNAASEGVLFADESYISDIEPHRELLMDMPFDYVSIPKMSKPVIHVKRANISGVNLKTWHEVIADMIGRTQAGLQHTPGYSSQNH